MKGDVLERHLFLLLKKMSALKQAKKSLQTAMEKQDTTVVQYLEANHVDPLTEICGAFIEKLPEVWQGKPLISSPEALDEVKPDTRRALMDMIYEIVDTAGDAYSDTAEYLTGADDFLTEEDIKAMKDE